MGIDITGNRYGRLVVIEKDEDRISKSGNRTKMWKCKCDCGNIKTVSQQCLIHGRTQSCGCYNKDSIRERSFIDLSGKRFGMLTAINEAAPYVDKTTGKRHTKWACKCDCGNEVDVIASALRNGKTKSCGCLRGIVDRKRCLVDLSGKKYGLLTVIEQVESKRKPSGSTVTMWKCKCDCGSVVDISAESLVSGHTRSCGCVKSFGEREVAHEMKELGINFSRQASFSDCVSPSGVLLKFDFAIKNENGDTLCLVEYQGDQHFLTDEDVGSFGKLQRDVTDRIKREYCTTHDIKLFEITTKDDIKTKINEIITETAQDNTVPSTQKTA